MQDRLQALSGSVEKKEEQGCQKSVSAWKRSITTETKHTVGRICQQTCPSLEKPCEKWVQDSSSQPAQKAGWVSKAAFKKG